MFRLRSARVGDIRVELSSGDCLGMGFRDYFLTADETLRVPAHELAALDESIHANGGDVADYEFVRRGLISAADGRTTLDSAPSDDQGPRKYLTRVNIIRIGDHIAITGYFQLLDDGGFGYRDRVEAVPSYRVAGDPRELLPRDALPRKRMRFTKPLIVDRGSLREMRSPMRVLQPRWIGLSVVGGFLVPVLVLIAAIFFRAHEITQHPLVRWFE
jgi:hypothetical protein